MEPLQKTGGSMTIDEYLKKSDELIKYAESNPDKAAGLLFMQLHEHMKLLSAIEIPEAA